MQSVRVDCQNGTEMYSILQAFCGDSLVVCLYFLFLFFCAFCLKLFYSWSWDWLVLSIALQVWAMRSVLCLGNAWLGGFMQKCVFQAVNSTHEWNTEWDASFCLFFWKNIYSLQIFKNCLNSMRRGHVTFLPRVFFFFLLEVKNLSRTLHTCIRGIVTVALITSKYTMDKK